MHIDRLVEKNPGQPHTRHGEVMLETYRQAFEIAQRRNLKYEAEIEQLKKQLGKKEPSPKRRAMIHKFKIIDGGKKSEEQPTFVN